MATTSDMLKRVQFQRQALDRRIEKGEALNTHLQRLTNLEKLVQDFSGTQAAIQQDPRYTGEGKAQQHATAAQQFTASLAWLWDLPNVLEEASHRLKNLLTTKPKPPVGNDILAFLREQEIRSAYRGKKQSDIDAAYGQAIARGDEETVRALVLAPGGSLVTPAIQEETERLQAKVTNPAAFQALAELTEIRGLAEELVKQFDAWLRGLGANPQDSASVVRKVA